MVFRFIHSPGSFHLSTPPFSLCHICSLVFSLRVCLRSSNRPQTRAPGGRESTKCSFKNKKKLSRSPTADIFSCFIGQNCLSFSCLNQLVGKEKDIIMTELDQLKITPEVERKTVPPLLVKNIGVLFANQNSYWMGDK